MKYKPQYLVGIEHRGMPCCSILVTADSPMLAAEKGERNAWTANGGILEDWFAFSVKPADRNRELVNRGAIPQ